MRKIIYILSFLGYSSFVIAADLPSKACLVLEADKIEVCLSEAHSMWDKKLNTVYKNVIGYLPKGKKTELQNQQHAWIKERDKKCEALSTTAEKKACYLDETQIKTLALKNQETDLMPKIFEGDWRVKYSKTAKDLEDYGDNDGFTILQKGKNICGTWMFFATGYYEGEFHARLDDSNIAQTIEACGRQYSPYTKTEWCNGLDWDKLGESDKTYITFKVCSNNKLYDTVADKKDGYLAKEGFACNLMEQNPNLGDGLKKKAISGVEKEKIIKDNPWLNKCLNYEE